MDNNNNEAEKALRYDLDRAGIERRDAEAVELIESRARIIELNAETLQVIRSMNKEIDTKLEVIRHLVGVVEHQSKELSGLKSVFLKYAEHKPSCARKYGTICKCGLDSEMREFEIEDEKDD